MSLSTEDVLHIICVDGVVRVEQKVEILDSLGQEEALLSVLQALVVNIMDGSIPTPAEIIIQQESHNCHHFPHLALV